MGAALVAVGVGSAGAAVLAMSLLASDLPNPMPEQEIIASAMASEPAPAAPATPQVSEEPIFKDLIPASNAAAQANVAAPAASSAPAAAPAAQQSEAELAALSAGDPRFAHDASAARGIEEVEDISGLVSNAFGPSRKVVKIPFDKIKDPPAEPEQTAAVVPAKPAAKETRAESSGKAPSGMALMVEDANIRSRPQKGAKVIGTVPARTQVQLVGCQSWCEIVVKGKRGYVWGDFVQRGGRASAKYNVTKASAKAEDTRKPDVVPASETAPHPDANRTR